MSKLTSAHNDYITHANADTLNALFQAITDATRKTVRSKDVVGGHVEDVAQEATLAAYTRLGEYDPKYGTFDAWVYRITLDKLGDHTRRARAEKRRDEVPLPTCDDGREIDIDHCSRGPAEHQTFSPHFMLELRAAAGKHTQLMELVIMLGTVERAAEALGISVRAAQQRLRSIAPNFLRNSQQTGPT